ncbi:DUF924 family protein [Actibacterium sp. 188UL27-1]|uniref:DUF924 family protein n=1 Tax=Actibacterium sp. 188UL27-1 TaxID=2786961 RepID=UPI00195D9ABA|nr:DUF924 family protein [Actibacterium sp. 188UL27-1]MBM7067520.1 DUF924 domain-containing protein [Actibacterium sp. 188UL27-1]
MVNPTEILHFWLQELEPKDWYQATDALDRTCADRFGASLTALNAGQLEHWRTRPDGALAYILLADQLSRNIHRNQAAAFATDARARIAVGQAIRRGWDLSFPEPERQFFYLPLEHSESLQHQSRAVRLIQTRMPEDGAQTLLHARAHRDVIRRFGRFPGRNVALGRNSSPAEIEFIENHGYATVLKELAPKQGLAA